MKYRILIPLILLIYLIQTTFIPKWDILGIHPNLLIIAIVMTVLIFDNKEGFTIAIILGVLQDIFSSKALGINTLIYFLIALGIYVFKEIFFNDYRFSVIMATALATFIYHISYYGVSVLILDNTRTFLFAVQIGLYEALFNTIIVYLLYGVAFKSLKGYETR